MESSLRSAGHWYIFFRVQFVVAIRALGLGRACGVGAGCIILSSFAWGATGATIWGDPPCVMANSGAAIFGVSVLVAGVAGLSYFGAPPTNAKVQYSCY